MSNRADAADIGTHTAVQEFLFREAGLLDRRDYAAWLGLAADDSHYTITAAVARDGGAEPARYAIVEETMSGLKSRIEQISNPRLTRAENPVSMIVRFVSTIETYRTDVPDEFSVTSSLLAYR